MGTICLRNRCFHRLRTWYIHIIVEDPERRLMDDLVKETNAYTKSKIKSNRKDWSSVQC